MPGLSAASARMANYDNGGSGPLARASAKGTVKWFNATKGYGFIQPSEGGADVFVHISAVEQAGLGSLNEGQKVSFDAVRGQKGKIAAENLKAV